jgi:hypothetical protein
MKFGTLLLINKNCQVNLILVHFKMFKVKAVTLIRFILCLVKIL